MTKTDSNVAAAEWDAAAEESVTAVDPLAGARMADIVPEPMRTPDPMYADALVADALLDEWDEPTRVIPRAEETDGYRAILRGETRPAARKSRP